MIIDWQVSEVSEREGVVPTGRLPGGLLAPRLHTGSDTIGPWARPTLRKRWDPVDPG